MRHRSHVLFSWIDEMIRHPKILDAVEDLLGPDILCWNTSFFIKEARDPGFVSWHQDATYWGLSSSDVATAWVAMSPANKVSGCMKFVAGTHLKQVEHEDTFDKNNLLTRGQEIAVEVDEAQAVHVELKPGQASLHHVLLFHGSEPNRSDERRDRARDPLYPDASQAGRRLARLGDAGARQGHAIDNFDAAALCAARSANRRARCGSGAGIRTARTFGTTSMARQCSIGEHRQDVVVPITRLVARMSAF